MVYGWAGSVEHVRSGLVAGSEECELCVCCVCLALEKDEG